MFSQQEVWRGMERDCYCCRPGPTLPRPAPASFTMEPYSVPRPSRSVPHPSFQQETSVMDVDSALSELDSLRSATGSAQASASSSGTTVGDQRPERKARVRSLSESMASASRRPSKSHSETSLYRPLEMEARGAHYRRACSMGTKMIGCSLSLPRKVGNYHMVQRNSAFVSDISAARLPLQHPPQQLPAHWVLPDSGVCSYSEQSSSKSSSPSSMGSYRDSDVLEERSRQRRMSRFRLDRCRRLRQPYSIPFRMCQSMSEESTASLNDFLTDAESEVSKSTAPSVGALVRSRSIDNLELAKLRLTDSSDARQTDSSLLSGQEVEQVATELNNLHMV
ncbi:uncharacterized protein LOC143290822 [Babylonia areolata]|uniref:uncharacterized protein LOC143290822 n=1 Tax=Babylonia areolata TaxID=304850 RepID=UPI003FCEEE7C